MDTAALVAKFDAYLDLIDACERASSTDTRRFLELSQSIRDQLPTIGALVRTMLPNAQLTQNSTGFQWRLVKSTIRQARQWALDRHEVARITGPTGPTLAAGVLHPVVWNAALMLWDSGHYGQAVRHAAEQLSTMLQGKLSRFDISGSKLVGQAFSLDPPRPSAPRLRFTKYAPDSEQWKSAHGGAMEFGKGCMMAIRNIATHGDEDLSQQEALEQLAALSVFARMIDAAEVVTA